MRIAVAREIDPQEPRVAATPETVKKFKAFGADGAVARGAGIGSGIPDAEDEAAGAEVGDDVYGEDPTINLLERRAAEIFGREAALFVPTGTMGNQVALRTLTQPGQEIVSEAKAHILDWEMATAAVFSGCLIRAVPTRDGILTWKDIEPVLYKRGAFRAATGAIEIENTHNMAGGSVTPVAR